jgi:hypothetical protein
LCSERELGRTVCWKGAPIRSVLFSRLTRAISALTRLANE